MLFRKLDCSIGTEQVVGLAKHSDIPISRIYSLLIILVLHLVGFTYRCLLWFACRTAACLL